MPETVRFFRTPLPRIPNRYPLYFVLFSAGNFLLAYFPLGLEDKLWIGLAALAVPFGCEAFTVLRHSDGRSGFPEWEPAIPAWGWVGVFLLALLPRFYGLVHPRWPVPDEGAFGFLSLELSRKWSWHFFFTHAQVPPLFNWLLALDLRLFGTSLISLRLFPFLLSLLALPAGYLAARKFFTDSTAFFCFAFFCFGFWPLFTFKFILFMSLALLFEVAALGVLGAVLRQDGPSLLPPIAVGAVLGAGFWVAIPWPLVVLAFLPPLYGKWRTGGFRKGAAAAFLIPLAVSAALFLLCSFLEKNGEHVRWLLLHETTANGAGRLRSLLSNGTMLFWEGHPGSVLGPSWGGLLNPLEGAACFLGALELLRRRNLPISRWLMFASFLFLLPGLLTSGLETFHNLLFLPVLAAVCALGLRALVLGLPRGLRWPAMALFLAGSALLNAFHLYRSDPSGAPSGMPQKAFEILDRYQRQSGPGLLLLDLSPDQEDQTLTLATYPFNAALNPGKDPSQARWAAVVVNSNYLYFLSRRFPGGRWYWLGPDGFWNQGGLVLMVVPVTRDNGKVLRNWTAFDRRMHGITAASFFDQNGLHAASILTRLLATQEMARTDPFLESLFCEKVVYDLRDSVAPPRLLPWLRKAVKEGYAAPHLLTTEGLLYLSLGRKAEARRALQRAARCPMDSSAAPRILRFLGR